MKPSTTKKLFAFIITVMMFSLLPEFIAAQKGNCTKCPKVSCPFGYICIHGDCKRYFPFLTNDSPANEADSISPANSNTISFQLMEAQNVSFKIYDALGILVKIIAERKMSEGSHQIEWGAKGEAGNAVQAGVYVLRMDAGNYTGAKKILIVK